MNYSWPHAYTLCYVIIICLNHRAMGELWDDSVKVCGEERLLFLGYRQNKMAALQYVWTDGCYNAVRRSR